MLNNSWFHWNSKYFSCPKIFEIRAYAYIANFSLADATWHYSVMFVGLSNITQWEMMDKYTYVDAVLVRRVIIGLGNCNCELWIERFGELSGDDILLDQNWLISSLPGSFEHSIYWLAVFCRWSTHGDTNTIIIWNSRCRGRVDGWEKNVETIESNEINQ